MPGSITSRIAASQPGFCASSGRAASALSASTTSIPAWRRFRAIISRILASSSTTSTRTMQHPPFLNSADTTPWKGGSLCQKAKRPGQFWPAPDGMPPRPAGSSRWSWPRSLPAVPSAPADPRPPCAAPLRRHIPHCRSVSGCPPTQRAARYNSWSPRPAGQSFFPGGCWCSPSRR